MMRRLVAIWIGVCLSAGCILGYGRWYCRIQAEVGDWQRDHVETGELAVAHIGRLAKTIVSVSIENPFTPVMVVVRAEGPAGVTISRAGARATPVGAFRRSDRKGGYVVTRVPRPFWFGQELHVPAGADLVVEFDHATVIAGPSVSEGCEVIFDVLVVVGGESELVPVRFRLVDFDRSWYFEPAFH